MSYEEIGKRARVSKRNASVIVKRLIWKGFMAPKSPAKPSRGVANTYIVFSYKTVLERLRQLNRLYVVKFGNSVCFVHPVPNDPTNSETPTAGQSSVLAVPAHPGAAATPSEAVPTDAASPPAMVATGDGGDVAATTQLDNVVETIKTDNTSTSILSDLLVKFGIRVDTPAAEKLVHGCRRNDPTASLEEIAHFTELKIDQLKRQQNIRNIIGLLIVAVPQCFVALASPLQEYRRERAAKRTREVEAARAIISESDADDESRRWAERILRQSEADESSRASR
jgi:hypothetical protein